MKEENTKQIKVNNHTFVLDVKRRFHEEGRKSVTFTIYGISMHPFLGSGRDKVILVPPAEPHIGQVVLAEVLPQRYALHRIIKIDGNTITMRGDGNPIDMTECFTTDKIVGTAEGFIRKGKYVSTSGKLWQRYSRLWQKCNPIRRPLLIIYRRIILKIFNI